VPAHDSITMATLIEALCISSSRHAGRMEARLAPNRMNFFLAKKFHGPAAPTGASSSAVNRRRSHLGVVAAASGGAKSSS
jgi:hypothetical protein